MQKDQVAGLALINVPGASLLDKNSRRCCQCASPMEQAALSGAQPAHLDEHTRLL
jgi:hypothetical protein